MKKQPVVGNTITVKEQVNFVISFYTKSMFIIFHSMVDRHENTRIFGPHY